MYRISWLLEPFALAVVLLTWAAPVRAETVGPPLPSTMSEARSSAAATPGYREAARDEVRLHGWRTDAALVSLGQIGDAVSTELALRHAGTQEWNPLLQNRSVRISAKLAIATAGSLACRELRKHGKPGHARGLSILIFAVGAAAAVHNMTIVGAR